MTAALGEEADRPPGATMSLARVRYPTMGSAAATGSVYDELERGVARDGLDDASALERELLVVGEGDEGAAAAAVGVLAVDALGHLKRRTLARGLSRLSRPLLRAPR